MTSADGRKNRGSPLTDEQLTEGHRLRALTPPVAWHRIAVVIDASETRTRYWLDQVFQRKMRSRNRDEEKSRGPGRDSSTALYDPERDGVVYQDPISIRLGDPPPGRREMLEAFAAAQAPHRGPRREGEKGFA